MNLVDAELVQDGPAMTFGSFRLTVPSEVISSRPGLDQWFGKKLILGIRPSNFEDVEFKQDSQATMKVTAELTEELGSEINVIFEIDAPQVTHDATKALAQDVGDEEEKAVSVESGHSLWTARVDPHSKVRAGSEISLAVDVSALHFFDPESGLAIGRTSDRAGAGAGAG
jgi:multiple sugar transport system ATP-binding protein